MIGLGVYMFDFSCKFAAGGWEVGAVTMQLQVELWKPSTGWQDTFNLPDLLAADIVESTMRIPKSPKPFLDPKKPTC